MSFSETNDTQSLIDQIQTGVRLDHQIENRGRRIARSVGLSKRGEDEGSVVVLGFGGDVLREGLRGFVEFEFGEDVESDAFAAEGEEVVVMRVSPVQELEDEFLVVLGFEEEGRGCFRGEVWGDVLELVRVASEKG